MTELTEMLYHGPLGEFGDLPEDERRRTLAAYQKGVLAADGDTAHEAVVAGLLHRDPALRRAAIRAVARRGGPLLEEVVEWALTDVDETVRGEALAGLPRAEHSPGVLRALLDMTGRTPRQLRDGCGTVTTAVDVQARGWAATLLKAGYAGEVVAALPAPLVAEELPDRLDAAGMVPVPAGRLRRGTQTGTLPGWLPVPPGPGPSTAPIGPFLMDEFPVTVREYDRFVDAVASGGHVFCHPDEPLAKDHRRSTVDDERFLDSHPATGVDWYDAYAYAASCGKRLPTEEEWEWAAQGPSHLAYPWGPAWDGTRCRWLGDLIDGVVDNSSWRAALVATDLSALPELTCAVRNERSSASEFGICGLSGNVWEWTATRYLDRTPLTPRFGTLYPAEVLGNWAAEAVIKGGSYASCPDQLSPAYRGPMSLFGRSPEIGFRCAATAGLQ